jgi:hypothetical protein
MGRIMSEPSVRIFTIPVSSATESGAFMPNNPEVISHLVAELNKAIELVQHEVEAPSISMSQPAEELVSEPLVIPPAAAPTNLTVEIKPPQISAPTAVQPAVAAPVFSRVR